MKPLFVSTPTLAGRNGRATAFTCLLASLLAACATASHAQTADKATTSALSCAASGPVSLPPGVNLERLQLLDKGLPFKVYTTFLAHDEQGAAGNSLPPEMAKVVDLNRSSLERTLADIIMRSRRFKVYDMHASTTAEQSDVEVTAKVVDAHQVLRPYLEGGRQIVESSVRLSIQVKNMYTGENLLQSDALVEGRTGRSNGRLIVTAAEDVNSPAVRQKLAVDFKKALYLAMDLADERIEELLRPMARVVSADDCTIQLYGGSRFGLQDNDELVVFRAQTRTLGESTVLASTRPVALVSCKGVGTESSPCTVIKAVPDYRPQDGDFAVITTESLQSTRVQ